ncbi:MAG: UDP-glucose 4-epimerase GalE [Corynebacterium sp.]|nr:UDP-glucose 4-epimerase GalE [Corynebacterium sp.]
MKFLVTGGAGYVGSVIARVLLEENNEVIIVDNLTTGNKEALPEAATFVEGNIATVANEVCATYKPDAVIHCAARSLVGESMEVPDEYWEDNVVTTLALLEAMRENKINNLVFSSTAATYGDPARVPITEDFPTQPTNTYGATKLSIDYMIESYAKAYGLAATSLRYFNVAGAYGGAGENRRIETHIIPLILQVALGHRDHIKIFGDDWNTPDGTCIRDYIHIKDLADAHLLAAAANTPGEHHIYNLGSGTGYSVKEVIEMCREVTGHEIPAEIAPRRAGDPTILVASSERFIAERGWEPKHTDLRTIVTDAWEYTSKVGLQGLKAAN